MAQANPAASSSSTTSAPSVNPPSSSSSAPTIVFHCTSVPSSTTSVASTAIGETETRSFFSIRPSTHSAALESAASLFPHLAPSSVYLAREVPGVGLVRLTEGTWASFARRDVKAEEEGKEGVYEVGGDEIKEEEQVKPNAAEHSNDDDEELERERRAKRQRVERDAKSAGAPSPRPENNPAIQPRVQVVSLEDYQLDESDLDRFEEDLRRLQLVKIIFASNLPEHYEPLLLRYTPTTTARHLLLVIQAASGLKVATSQRYRFLMDGTKISNKQMIVDFDGRILEVLKGVTWDINEPSLHFCTPVDIPVLSLSTTQCVNNLGFEDPLPQDATVHLDGFVTGRWQFKLDKRGVLTTPDRMSYSHVTFTLPCPLSSPSSLSFRPMTDFFTIPSASFFLSLSHLLSFFPLPTVLRNEFLLTASHHVECADVEKITFRFLSPTEVQDLFPLTTTPPAEAVCRLFLVFKPYTPPAEDDLYEERRSTFDHALDVAHHQWDKPFREMARKAADPRLFRIFGWAVFKLDA